MRIILLDEARWQLEEQDVWWREHRDHGDLLLEELVEALRQLSELPETGQRYRWARGKLIRRWLMKKTGFHVYYFYDRERELLEIHSLWGARCGRGPRL